MFNVFHLLLFVTKTLAWDHNWTQNKELDVVKLMQFCRKIFENQIMSHPLMENEKWQINI